MAENIEWHGLTLEKDTDDAYVAEIGGSRVMATRWGSEWLAYVGSGRCQEPQAEPQAALDLALRDHEAKRGAILVKARQGAVFDLALARAKEPPVPI